MQNLSIYLPIIKQSQINQLISQIQCIQVIKIQHLNNVYQKNLGMSNSKPQLRNLTFNQTFESSLIEQNSQKFLIDKSLIKGIKENDVNKIIDANATTQGNQNRDGYDQLGELGGIVIQTRKNYDQVKTNTTKCQQQIAKLKSQKQKLLSQQQKYTATINQAKQQFEQTSKRLQQVTNLMQSTCYRKDIYNNSKENYKFDLLVLKKRYLDKDVRLLRDTTKLRTIRTEHDSKVKLSLRCREVLGEMEKTVIKKELQRTTKIEEYYDILSRKQFNQQSRQTRQKQIKQAMLSAMTDKLSQQRQWQKMFLSNLVLKSILKAKMQRLMNQYNKVQLAFHRMKQGTSIKSANDFIERYINREQTYGMLLESIAEKERLLEEGKEERDRLERVHVGYLYRSEEIGQGKKLEKGKERNIKGPDDEQNHTNLLIQKYNNQLAKINRQKQLIHQWGIKFLSCFSQNTSQTKQSLVQKYPKSNTKQLFLHVLTTLKQFLSQLQSQKSHPQKIEQAFLKNNPKDNRMTADIYERNTRIKTMSAYEGSGAGDGDAFEEKDMVYDDLSEADYLQYNRRTVKKNDLQSRKFRIKTKPN